MMVRRHIRAAVCWTAMLGLGIAMLVSTSDVLSFGAGVGVGMVATMFARGAR